MEGLSELNKTTNIVAMLKDVVYQQGNGVGGDVQSRAALRQSLNLMRIGHVVLSHHDMLPYREIEQAGWKGMVLSMGTFHRDGGSPTTHDKMIRGAICGNSVC